MRNVKFTLVWLMAATVAMAGCVMPPELMDQMNKEEGTESLEETEAQSAPPTPPERKVREIEMPEEPEFHDAATVVEADGLDNVTGVDVRSNTGSIYVAPYDGEGWLVQVGAVSVDALCQPDGSDAEDRFDILTEVTDGVLNVEIRPAGGSEDFLGALVESGNAWADVKVFVPTDVAEISVGYVEMTEADYRWFHLGWCGGYGWGTAVHGFVSDALTITTENRGLDVRALQVTEAFIETSNGRLTVGDSIFGTATVESANGKVLLEAITADVLTGTTKNAAIMTEDVDALELTLETANGKIHAVLAEEAAGLVTLRSENGKILVEAPTKEDYGYKVTAETENAEVEIDLPDFEADEESDEEFVTGMTADYDTRTYRYVIDAATSNADVMIG